MTMKNILLTIAFLSMFGCATQGKFEERLKRWEGQDINQLMNSWGVPDKKFTKPDGKTMVVYMRERGNLFCETTFTFDSLGLIRFWRYNGNACTSY